MLTVQLVAEVDEDDVKWLGSPIVNTLDDVNSFNSSFKFKQLVECGTNMLFEHKRRSALNTDGVCGSGHVRIIRVIWLS